MLDERIIVTGGCGFIGSNFIRRILNKTNAKVLNIDILSYAGNIITTKDFNENKNYSFVHGDISDRKTIKDIINNFKPSRIFNFAAESHVDRSIESPENFIKSNIYGTFILLDETLAYLNNKLVSDLKFIHISTDEVYGSLGKTGSFRETSNYNPSSPYSASKASSDHLVNAWYKTYNLPTIITNCSNNYGPYQYPEKLIPVTVISAIKDQYISVYGKGQNVRDWLHVEDYVEAIIVISKNGRIGETYNIGGNNEIRNLDLVNMICEALDNFIPSKKYKSYKELIKFVDDRPGHDNRYAINTSKIKNELNWKAKINFKDGLKKTVKWYLDNLEWSNKITNDYYNFERLGVVRK